MNAKWEWLRPVCKRNRIELQLDAKGNPRARMLVSIRNSLTQLREGHSAQ
jgi:hypothetical protein